MPYITYADIESLIKKNRWVCKYTRKFFNNKNWKAYSLWIFNVNYMVFDNIENKHTFYCGEDCMKRFCTSLGIF